VAESTIEEVIPEPTVLGKRSLRDQILEAQDISSEQIEVPEWKVTVEVRGMTGKERAQFMQEFSTDTGALDYERLYPSLLIKVLYDPESGEPIFRDSDGDFINMKSGQVLERLGRVATRLSGMTPEAEEEAKERFQE
jgi:hypothetical protein